jgi:hypothetical protein
VKADETGHEYVTDFPVLTVNSINPNQFILTADVDVAENTDYVITYDAPFAGTITTARTESQSGTGTVTFKIGSTPLGGSANSASTTAQEQAHASANTFAKGDTLKFTISSVSALQNLQVALYGTRTS